jgi:nucleotide-binding universal stress UspA family protein
MPQNPNVIVVGVDFSELGDRAFRRAHELASLRPKSEIHAIWVVPAATAYPANGNDTVEASSPVAVEKLAARLSTHVDGLLAKLEGFSKTGVRVFSHVRVNVPLLGITQLASDLEAELIVVGTHGRHGIARWLLGSVAEGVVRHATCAVLVIPPEAAVVELPKIEPICPHCVEERKASNGQELWCEQHRQRHGQRHTFHQRDRMSEDISLPLVMR